ncbi:MAG: TonB-dependent receptor [Bacteroidota bacterium]
MRFYCLTFICCILSLFTFAQTDSLSVILDDVVIEDNRMALPFSEVSRNIEIITRKDIEVAPVVSVAELLRYVSGVDIRQRGAHGVQADVSIRGGTFDQTLILVNGIRMSDPQTGHHAMNLPVDIENIERIEVLKGPAARIYGQNAFTGAINIVTKTPDSPFIKIKLQAGEHTLGGVNVSAAFQHDNFDQYFSFSKDFSSGYRYNTDYDINNFFYQAKTQVGAHDLHILAGYTEREFGANGFYASPDFRDQYEEIQTSVAAVEYRINQGDWIVKPRVYWRRNQDEYVFIRSNPSIFRNLHINHTVGAEVNAQYQSSLGLTGIGVDVNRVSLVSNNLGSRERIATSVFAEHRFQDRSGRLDVTPGVLFNYFSDFDANLLPGVDVGYRLSDRFRAFANAGYTYRVPTFTDLYYEDRANIGNENLQPESALTYEAGLKYQDRFVYAQVSAFSRQGTDLIDWTKQVDTLRWQPQNFSSVDMNGIDASIRLQLPKNELFGLNQLQLGYTYIDAQINEIDVPFSRYSLENLRHQFIASTDVQLTRQLSTNIRYRYVDRVSMDDYGLVDWRLTWQQSRWRVFLEASNLFDVAYRETNLVDMPGRWIRGGFAVTFDEFK